VSRSSSLGCFPYPRHEHATPVSCSSHLGCSTTLSTTHYHPDMKNATLVSRFRIRGVPLPFPPPSTTQTRGTRPHGPILRVWGVFPFPRHFLDPDTKNATTGSRPSCLGYFPLTQTQRMQHWVAFSSLGCFHLTQTQKCVMFSCPSPILYIRYSVLL